MASNFRVDRSQKIGTLEKGDKRFSLLRLPPKIGFVSYFRLARPCGETIQQSKLRYTNNGRFVRIILISLAVSTEVMRFWMVLDLHVSSQVSVYPGHEGAQAT